MELDYSKDLQIGDDLDAEWRRQSDLYERYSELLADAISERDEAKELLDFTKSRVELAYRRGDIDPNVKITEGSVSALVTTHPDVKKAEEGYRKATHRKNVLDGVVEAFSHKKKALEKLADARIFGLNSEPKSGRVDAIREMRRRNRAEEQEDDEG